MNDDHGWLKNPILPRPPALPRFSAAELRLVDEERPSTVVRVAPRKKRSAQTDASRPARLSKTTRKLDTVRALESGATESRRIA